MPGLFGILAKRPDLSRTELGRLGRRMALAMQTAPWLRSEVWSAEGFCGGRVHLGVVHGAPQPVASRHGRIHLWFDGEAYDPDATDDSTLALDEVLSLVHSGDPWSRVDGTFNLAAFRSDGSELTLVTDRLGFRPLYFAETNDWFAYAAEVKSLLAILPRQPDMDRTSLCQFLAADHLFGQRTWSSGIELLPPASRWRVDARRRETRRYWSFGDIEHQLFGGAARHHDYAAFLRGSDVLSTVARGELLIDQYLHGRAQRYLERGPGVGGGGCTHHHRASDHRNLPPAGRRLHVGRAVEYTSSPSLSNLAHDT